MRKYHLTGFVHYIQIANDKLFEAYQYAKKHGERCLGKTGRTNGHNVYLWSCKNGVHQWEYPLEFINSSGERQCRYIFEDLLGEMFSACRPSFLGRLQ